MSIDLVQKKLGTSLTDVSSRIILLRHAEILHVGGYSRSRLGQLSLILTGSLEIALLQKIAFLQLVFEHVLGNIQILGVRNNLVQCALLLPDDFIGYVGNPP